MVTVAETTTPGESHPAYPPLTISRATLTVSFYWGPCLGAFAAWTPCIQSFAFGRTYEDLRAAIYSHLRIFFSDLSPPPTRSTGTPLFASPAQAANSAFRAVQTAAAAAAVLELRFSPVVNLSTRLSTLFGLKRDIITIAVPSYLPHRATKGPDFDLSKRFLVESLDSIERDYPGEYVAVIDRAVVFHHRDLDEIAKYIKHHKDRPVLVERVGSWRYQPSIPSPFLHARGD